MTWTVRVEITQITFPWKCPCFSLETEVLAYMFVQPCLFTSAGGVSGSDGPAVEVLAETFPRTAPFHWLGCIDLTAPRCYRTWRRAHAVWTCVLYRHMRTCSPAMVEWINEIAAVGVVSKRFHLQCLLSSSSMLLNECQRWMLCSSPPKDKIRTTCSSYLLARESQADLLTHAPRCSPPLSCLSLMSGKWKVVPWQFALDSLPEGVRFKRSGLFPFSLVHFSSARCSRGRSHLTSRHQPLLLIWALDFEENWIQTGAWSLVRLRYTTAP